MDIHDELRALQWELQQVVNKTTQISKRLSDLEDLIEAPEEEQEPTPVPPEMMGGPRPVEPGPPPPPPPPVESVTKPVVVPEAPKGSVYVPGPPTEPGFVELFINEQLARFKARRQELGWEGLVGTYGLPRIAMVCIVIAVVFFLSLAIQRWGSQWLPHLRVAIGYTVCIALLVLAWRMEAKFQGLARVLYAGAFAVMYFVSFATHYVSFSRIFESPVPTLALLAVVVVAWAAAAQMRQSKVIAVLVTGLGHLTILIATLTLERPASFSMAGLIFLSAGSAFFLLRNRWYYVAALGVVGSYVNDLVILLRSHGGNPVFDFWASMAVLSVFFLTFALAELMAPEELRRDKVPLWFRNSLVTVNSVGFLIIGTLLVSSFDFTRYHQDAFRFVFAAVLLLFALAYLLLKARDPLYNVYIVKAVALATLALATRYGGSTLSAWLAIETVVLLVSARRSTLVVTRALAFGVAFIALIHVFSTTVLVHPHGLVLYEGNDYWVRVLHGLLQVAAFMVASQLYQRTDWSTRSLRPAKWMRDIQELLWQLDLLAERPAIEVPEKPLGGLLFPYIYAGGAALIYVFHTHPLVMDGHRLGALAAFAVLAAVAAYLTDSKPFGFASLAVAVGAALPVGLAEMASRAAFAPYPAIGGVVALAALALLSEGKRFGTTRGLDHFQSEASPWVLYGMVALLMIVGFEMQLGNMACVIAFALTGVAAALLVFVLQPACMGLISLVFILCASFKLIQSLDPLGDPRWRFFVLGMVALLVAGDRFYKKFKELTKTQGAGEWLCVALCMTLLFSYYRHESLGQWLLPALIGTCFAFCAYGMVLRSVPALATGLVTALMASVAVVHRSYSVRQLDRGQVVSFVMLAVFWLAVERVFTRLSAETRQRVFKLLGLKEEEQFDPSILPIVLFTGLLVVMAYRIPHLLHANLAYITLGWFGVAGLSFVLSLVLKRKEFRYAGLILIVLSLLRLFLVDMREQDPLLRVAAFAVVGAGLLAISVGYFKWMARVKAGKVGQKEGE